MVSLDAKRRDLNEGLAELCEIMAGGGAVLRTVPRDLGGRPPKTPDTNVGSFQATEYQAAIAEIGFAERTAQRWQQLSRVSRSDRDAYYEQRIDKGELIRTADLWRLGMKQAPHEIGPRQSATTARPN